MGYGGSNAFYGFDLTDDFRNILFELKTGGNVQTVDLSADGARVYFGGHFANVSVDCPWVSGNVNDAAHASRWRTSTVHPGAEHIGPDRRVDAFVLRQVLWPWDIFSTGPRSGSAGIHRRVRHAQFMLARFSDI